MSRHSTFAIKLAAVGLLSLFTSLAACATQPGAPLDEEDSIASVDGDELADSDEAENTASASSAISVCVKGSLPCRNCSGYYYHDADGCIRYKSDPVSSYTCNGKTTGCGTFN